MCYYFIESEFNMKILVIGGSYFFGRWFVQFAYQNNDVTVLNRGNIPIGVPGITEWKCDRHDVDNLRLYAGTHFDCVVDFCAYRPGDIKLICDIFDFDRYIFISTVDVYKKGTSNFIDEESVLEDMQLIGDVGEYINGKVSLEKELIECCTAKNSEYISVRPGIIYGPANYAPRESMYFEWIKNDGRVIKPKDSTGTFQFIYVKDAVLGIIKLCEMRDVYSSYNFCNKDDDTYESFHEALKQASIFDYEEISLELADILANEVMLPFPITKSESEHYCTKRFEELGIETTPLHEGLMKSFAVLS